MRLKNIIEALERLLVAKEKGGVAWESLAERDDLELWRRLATARREKEPTTTPDERSRMLQVYPFGELTREADAMACGPGRGAGRAETGQSRWLGRETRRLACRDRTERGR